MGLFLLFFGVFLRFHVNSYLVSPEAPSPVPSPCCKAEQKDTIAFLCYGTGLQTVKSLCSGIPKNFAEYFMSQSLLPLGGR